MVCPQGPKRHQCLEVRTCLVQLPVGHVLVSYALGSVIQRLPAPLKLDFPYPKMIGLFLHLCLEETCFSLLNGLAYSSLMALDSDKLALGDQ